MSTTNFSDARWRKSNRSGGAGCTNCVEVAFVRDGAALRDSKNPTGPALVFSAQAWAAFLAHLKSD